LASKIEVARRKKSMFFLGIIQNQAVKANGLKSGILPRRKLLKSKAKKTRMGR
jgi:hypothetical protein